jgi:putative aldouronate transport system substrate-binding protein
LDDLGLGLPQTIEDWDVMLKAFRDEKGATNGYTGVSSGTAGPFALLNVFAAAFGIRVEEGNGFFIEGTEAVYSYTHPGFRDFLELMAYWYEERLIDQNIFTVQRAEVDAAVLSGASGAVRAAGGGMMGPYLNQAKANDPDTTFDLTATRWPSFDANELVRHGGTSNILGDQSRAHAAITTSCRNVELVTRLLDFGYSEEGHKLYNYGVEGVSYNMSAGLPIFTEEITNHPTRTFAQSLSNHARSAVSGPFNQDAWYIRGFYEQPQQKAALDLWRQQNNPESTMLPPVSYTVAEASTMTARMADINTYRLEQVALFISGAQPINDSTWNTYIDTINGMGISDVQSIVQDALDRFNAR